MPSCSLTNLFKMIIVELPARVNQHTAKGYHVGAITAATTREYGANVGNVLAIKTMVETLYGGPVSMGPFSNSDSNTLLLALLSMVGSGQEISKNSDYQIEGALTYLKQYAPITLSNVEKKRRWCKQLSGLISSTFRAGSGGAAAFNLTEAFKSLRWVKQTPFDSHDSVAYVSYISCLLVFFIVFIYKWNYYHPSGCLPTWTVSIINALYAGVKNLPVWGGVLAAGLKDLAETPISEGERAEYLTKIIGYGLMILLATLTQYYANGGYALDGKGEAEQRTLVLGKAENRDSFWQRTCRTVAKNFSSLFATVLGSGAYATFSSLQVAQTVAGAADVDDNDWLSVFVFIINFIFSYIALIMLYNFGTAKVHRIISDYVDENIA